MSSHFNYQLRLKLRHPYDPYLGGITPLLTILLLGAANSACGGGGGGGGSSGGTGNRPTPQPTPPATPNPQPPPPPQPQQIMTDLSGRVYDGPVQGARVYVDVNNNGQQDEGDILIGTSDAMGRYTGQVPIAHADKPLLAVLDGAIDRGDPDDPDDDRPLSGTWRAPQGSVIISPLTELQVQTNPQIVNDLLALLANIDITQYDPYSDENRDSAQAQQIIAAAQRVLQYFASLPANIPLSQIENLDRVPTNINLLVMGTLNTGATGAGRKMGELEIADDAFGINTASITQGGNFFEFRQNAEGVWELWLKAGVTMPTGQTDLTINYRVTSTGAGTNQYDSAATILFGDQVPTRINLRVTETLNPGATGAGRKIGELEIADDGLGTNTPSITQGGTFFEFRQNTQGIWELWLKEGLTLPTGQTGFTINYRVTSTGHGTQNYDSTATIAFGDQVPTSINLRLTTTTLSPGATGAGRKMGELEITDDGLGTNTPTITQGGSFFEFRQNTQGVWELWLKAGLTIPTTQTDFTINYRVTSTGNGANQYDSTATITVEDHVPTSINLHLTTHTLSTGATGTGRKMGELEIIDDGLGTNTPSLTQGGNFFEFRQNAEGVWELWLKAGLTIPTTQTDFTINYRVTSTGHGTSNYDSTAIIIIGETVNIYEHHPLTKPIYDAGDDGTFALTQNYGDNDLFRITADGRIWWRAAPDYENPQDGTAGGTGLNARDNIYQIEITHTASGGTVTKTRLAVQVENIARELDVSSLDNIRETRLPHVALYVYNLDPSLIQGANTPYLLAGTSWAVPDTGPIIITWSLSGASLSEGDVISTLNTQADSETARAKIETALAAIEAVTNLKFIEVARDDSRRVSDFEFIFQNDRTSPYPYYGLADYPGSVATNLWLHASSAGAVYVSVLLHEIGHSLGLKHINEVERGWPSIASLNSIMSDGSPGRRLQTADIEALQFLYGAPGTPGHYIFSRVSDSLQTAGERNAVHFFNVNENIGTDTIALTPANLDIYRPGSEAGIIYSLPTGRFDNDLFTIDADDYEIRFKQSPDYENPHDMAGGAPYSENNVYELLLFRDFPGPTRPGGSHLADEYHSIIIEVKNVDETIDTSTQLDII